MAQITKSISYRYWHLIIGSMSNPSLRIKLLVKNTLFKYYLN